MEHIVFVEATVTGAGLKAVENAKKKNMEITFFTAKRNTYIAKFSNQPSILDLVDRIVDVDTNCAEEVIKAVKELNKKNPITAVTTFADFYVPQAAAAAEYLGLPTIPSSAALNARNKFLTRKLISENSPELNPIFYLVDTEEDAIAKSHILGYPLVIKPQDENDSFDVILINSQEELVSNFNRIMSKSLNRIGQKKASGGVLLEEYIEGQEYSVETLQGASELPIQLIGITRKYLTGVERGHFVEVGHCFPVSEHKEQIFEAVSTVLKILGIHSAVCHTEVKINKDGKVKIVEVNPRLAGGKIGSHLIEATTNVDAVDLVIDCARGLKPVWNGVYNCGAAIYNIPSKVKGTVKSLPDTTSLNIPEVITYSFPLKVGQTVQPPLSNGDLIGQIIVKDEDANKALSLAKKLANEIVIEID